MQQLLVLCILVKRQGITLSVGFACSIQALLSAPNPDDPLADNVAKEWKENEALAMRTGDLIMV